MITKLAWDLKLLQESQQLSALFEVFSPSSKASANKCQLLVLTKKDL